LKDGDTFMVGNIKFEVMHTPGHTPEHITFIITDTAGADQPIGIFTGDFVFAGAVGRPDLLEEAAGVAGASEEGARQMFQSIQRFKQLPDYMQVWPGHGAGSACGKALGAIPSSTVGYEKLFNASLSFDDEETFMHALLDGQPEPPKYFAMMKHLNKAERPLLKNLPKPAKMDIEQLKEVIDQGSIVVDTRQTTDFAASHIPGTINIPANNSLPNWAGWLVNYDKPFYLIADTEHVNQIVRDLIYIGLDNVEGYLDTASIQQWPEPLESYETITPLAVAEKVANNEVTLIDVRATDEWDEGHIPEAKHLMLGYLADQADQIPTDKPIVVQCRSGFRSAIGASVLQAQGIKNVINLAGGYIQWAAGELPIERN
ncbi:MAG: rhodanese-like domain-containing protein, partial [Chloroflexota bacterium]